MESIKAFWKTRAYSRIFIDNIENQGFSPEIIYYKIKSSEKKERKESFSFITVHRKLTLIGYHYQKTNTGVEL